MKIKPSALVVMLSLACASALAQTPSGPPVDPIIDRCKVILVDDVEIPAGEMGALTYLGVKEGATVTEDAEIAKIDDRQALIAREAAKYGLRAANQRATVEVEIEHSKAAAAVAKADYEDLERANSGDIRNVVTATDVRRAKLEWDRAVLAIEKAEHDMALAGLDAWTKKAELDAAQLAIDQRTVKAPFNGQVAEVFRQQNEWVNKGDPILRLIRLDTLYVDGALYLDQHNPRDIRGCEVTVEVPVGRGEMAQVPGRIVYVNPELIYGADRQSYYIRAEITNRTQQGQWLVLPNQLVTMKIHLGTATTALSSREQ